jgi:hypothetical protein
VFTGNGGCYSLCTIDQQGYYGCICQPGAGREAALEKDWEKWWPDIPLVILPSPFRSIITPLLEYLDEIDRQRNDGRQAVVILPEFVPAKWWHTLLHNQTSFVLKTELLYHRRQFGYQRVIIDVPFHLRK